VPARTSLILLGWLVGASSGVLLGIAFVVAFMLPIPSTPMFLTTLFGLPFASIPAVIVVLLIVLLYLLGYVIATLSIASALPAITAPLKASVRPPGPTSVMLPPRAGELFARSLMIGGTAALNAVMLTIMPVLGVVLALWAFVIISLALIRNIALNRFYQAFLGWSAWVFPMSYFATVVGWLLFMINAPFALAAGGIGAFRVDYRTGAVESAGGLVGIPALNGGFVGGFSLGNFNFLTSPLLQGSFSAQTLSAHESGHTLNTAAFGGVMLWINAVDENVPPFAKHNLAYGELTTESHAQAMAAPPTRVSFFVNLWG
jgi:hypothetical protein